MPWVWAYAAALIVMLVLDGVWLGVLMKDFYFNAFGDALRKPFWVAPAALFYLAYPLGVLALALRPMPTSAWQAFAWCSLAGLFAYGTYDLTNLATLKFWTIRLAMVDMLWGMVISGLMGVAAWWAWTSATA